MSDQPAARVAEALWHPGALFHVVTRYPRKAKAPRVDRLAEILRKGLLAPASCWDGSVCSDLNLLVTGVAVPYESLIFLHRFGPQSGIYTFCDPGRFIVFVNPTIAVLTPEAMGANWIELCQDEVYVLDRVAPENLTGVVVHPMDADSVKTELNADFRRLGIPLFDRDGNVVMPEPPHTPSPEKKGGEIRLPLPSQGRGPGG